MPQALTDFNLSNAKNIPSFLRFHWKSIPMLSIITGKNAIGKSVLLEEISKYCTRESKKVVYIKSDFSHTISPYSTCDLTEDSESIGSETQTNILTIFSSAIDSFNNLKKRIDNDTTDHEDIINFYIKNEGKEDNYTYTHDEIKQIFAKNNLDAYHRHRLKEEWGSDTPPEEEIKELLSKYPLFKHSIYFEYNTMKFRRGGNLVVGFHNLSSAEKVILSVIAWQYCQQGYTTNLENGNNGKADIIVLDEIDKHLDPHSSDMVMSIIKEVFVDRGIQVVMTTHRIDTIALVKQDWIYRNIAKLFTIKETKELPTHNINQESKTPLANDETAEPEIIYPTKIVPITKLEAMYRLTKNLRQFTGHRFEVCTEGFYDAYFYSGVYHSLLDMSKNTPRDRNPNPDCRDTLLPDNIMSKNLYAYDLDTNQNKFIGRALSQRYQMFFRGVSKAQSENENNVKGDGSCKDVDNMIKREETAFIGKSDVNILEHELFGHKEFHIPYGIVDADYRVFSAVDHENSSLHNRVTCPNSNSKASRYSVENFLFDPIILCSVLSIEEINLLINNSMIKENLREEMKETCKNSLDALSNPNYSSVIKTNSEPLSKSLKKYFRIIFLTISELSQNSLENLSSISGHRLSDINKKKFFKYHQEILDGIEREGNDINDYQYKKVKSLSDTIDLSKDLYLHIEATEKNPEYFIKKTKNALTGNSDCNLWVSNDVRTILDNNSLDQNIGDMEKDVEILREAINVILIVDEPTKDFGACLELVKKYKIDGIDDLLSKESYNRSDIKALRAVELSLRAKKRELCNDITRKDKKIDKKKSKEDGVEKKIRSDITTTIDNAIKALMQVIEDVLPEYNSNNINLLEIVKKYIDIKNCSHEEFFNKNNEDKHHIISQAINNLNKQTQSEDTLEDFILLRNQLKHINQSKSTLEYLKKAGSILEKYLGTKDNNADDDLVQSIDYLKNGTKNATSLQFLQNLSSKILTKSNILKWYSDISKKDWLRNHELLTIPKIIEAQIELFRKMKDLDKCLEDTIDVPMIFRNNFDHNKISHINITYPKLFFRLRGHFLEEYCFGNSKYIDEQYTIADWISIRIRQNGLSVIPLDLAQVFFDLNKKIRTNVRNVIKPDFNNKSPILSGNHDTHTHDNSSDTNDGTGSHIHDNSCNKLKDTNDNNSKIRKQNGKSNKKDVAGQSVTNIVSNDIHANKNAYNSYNNKNYQYQTTDIQYIGEQLIKYQGVTFIGALGVGAHEINDKALLKKAGEIEGKKAVGVYNTGGNHWIAFGIQKNNNGIIVAYCDSLGYKRRDFESVALETFDNTIQNKKNDGTLYVPDSYFIKTQKDSVSCGLFALKNMHIFALAKDLLNISSFYKPHDTVYKPHDTEIMNLRQEYGVIYAKTALQNAKKDLELESLRAHTREIHKPEAVIIKSYMNNNGLSVDCEIVTTAENPTDYRYSLKFLEGDHDKFLSLLHQSNGVKDKPILISPSELIDIVQQMNSNAAPIIVAANDIIEKWKEALRALSHLQEIQSLLHNSAPSIDDIDNFLQQKEEYLVDYEAKEASQKVSTSDSDELSQSQIIDNEKNSNGSKAILTQTELYNVEDTLLNELYANDTSEERKAEIEKKLKISKSDESNIIPNSSDNYINTFTIGSDEKNQTNTNNELDSYCIDKILYTNHNLILKQDELVHQAGQIAGMNGINRLIDLGEDDDVARGIIRAAKEYGISQVLTILLDDIRASHLTSSVITKPETLNSNVKIDTNIDIMAYNKTSWADRCDTENRARSHSI